MASYLFQALLLLLSVVFCALCGFASADYADMGAKLFKKGPVVVLKPKNSGKETLDSDFIFSPFIVGANGVMVAFVEVINTDGKNDILTKYVGTHGEKWGEKVIEDNGKNWEAQLALKSKIEHVAFASVARNNSIYVLSASIARSSQQLNNTKAWNFQLTVGTITYGADATREKKIEWDTQNVSDRFVTEQIQQSLKGVIPRDGSAFLMEDGTFVFVVRAWSGATDKYVFVTAHSKDPSSDFTFTYVNTTANCRSCFFSWGEKLFMAPKHCFSDNIRDYKLQASNDMGKTWREATGPLAEKLKDMTKESSSFTSVTIGERRVLLFTKRKPKYNASLFFEYLNIYLVVADESNIKEVGPIFTNVTALFDGSFLYTNDELFFLSSLSKDFKINIIITRLKEHLEKIKRLLNEWHPENYLRSWPVITRGCMLFGM